MVAERAVAARSAVVLAGAVVAESTYRQDEALRDRRVGRHSASDPLFDRISLLSAKIRRPARGLAGRQIPSVDTNIDSQLIFISGQR